MIFTTEILANYLGKEALILLADAPFRNWTFEKSFERDVERPRVDYVFTQEGMDFVCDGDDKVRTIFLYFDGVRFFRGGVQDLPVTFSRQQVIAYLGLPSKSGGKISDPILGKYGAWDRFTRTGYVIHIEYRLDADAINKITLMRADVVP